MIRPNQSLSWRAAVQVFIAIAGTCLTIGVYFALHGFWPVLPFAGLELAVLGSAFYLCLWRGQLREVISVDADRVMVEKGRRQPQQRWECPRAWARVSLERSHIAWYPSRLSVAYQDRRIEIGEFLTEHERRLLAGELREVIRRFGQPH